MCFLYFQCALNPNAGNCSKFSSNYFLDQQPYKRPLLQNSLLNTQRSMSRKGQSNSKRIYQYFIAPFNDPQVLHYEINKSIQNIPTGTGQQSPPTYVNHGVDSVTGYPHIVLSVPTHCQTFTGKMRIGNTIYYQKEIMAHYRNPDWSQSIQRARYTTQTAKKWGTPSSASRENAGKEKRIKTPLQRGDNRGQSPTKRRDCYLFAKTRKCERITGDNDNVNIQHHKQGSRQGKVRQKQGSRQGKVQHQKQGSRQGKVQRQKQGSVPKAGQKQGSRQGKVQRQKQGSHQGKVQHQKQGSHQGKVCQGIAPGQVQRQKQGSRQGKVQRQKQEVQDKPLVELRREANLQVLDQGHLIQREINKPPITIAVSDSFHFLYGVLVNPPPARLVYSFETIKHNN